MFFFLSKISIKNEYHPKKHLLCTCGDISLMQFANHLIFQCLSMYETRIWTFSWSTFNCRNNVRSLYVGHVNYIDKTWQCHIMCLRCKFEFAMSVTSLPSCQKKQIALTWRLGLPCHGQVCRRIALTCRLAWFTMSLTSLPSH